jgi:hypothetical protein
MRSQFLYSATRSMFEEVGFTYEPPKGKKLRDAQDGCTCQSVSAGTRRLS